MSRLRVASFAISLDGYGAGPDQSLENPLGIGGMGLHGWMLKTDTFCRMVGRGSGTKDVDDQFAARGFENLGAWILGRNMFGPVRQPLAMAGGTTFHFVTGGIHEALEQAKDAARGKDIRVGGGVSTVRQYLAAGLLDELHIAVSPVLLGSGENLFGGINLASLGYRCVEHVPTVDATHVVLRKGM